MKNILVAIGRTQNADQLIAQAVKLAKLTNGKIWVLHVTRPDADDFIGLEAGPQYLYSQRAEGRKKEAAFVKECAERIIKNHSIPAEGLLIEGSVPKVIKRIVDEHNIDLVVAGHQPKDFIYELFTANQKKDLVDELKIPLLAVPVV